MNKTSGVSLENTLYMVQLARETALAKGREKDAERLSPVVDAMRNLVSAQQQNALKPLDPKGILAQQDFRALLNASQVRMNNEKGIYSSSSALERGRIVQSMASSNMSDVEIAYHLGMTREEVRLILSVQNHDARSEEVMK